MTRTIALFIVLGFVVVASAVFLVRVSPRSAHITTITDPAAYSECLRHFPSDLAAMAPRAIPDDATQVSMSFRQASGLGPSSTRLQLQFTVPPERAQELLGHAQSKLPAAAVNAISGSEVQAARGDQVATIRIDPQTGEVVILLTNN